METIHTLAYGILKDLKDYVDVVTSWADFQSEAAAILQEITQKIPDLGVCVRTWALRQ
jgi:hypothetical protein